MNASAHSPLYNPPGPLSGVRVLVVEDQYLLADDLVQALAREGASVLGPVATVEHARALLGEPMDAAVLDIDLRGEAVFPVADALAERNASFVFVSGFERCDLPARFADRPHLQKPVQGRNVVRALARALENARPLDGAAE